MKLLNIFCALLFLSFFFACGVDINTEEEQNATIIDTNTLISTSDSVTADTVVSVLPPPPITELKKEVEETNTAKSPLLDKGCCKEKEKSTDLCCCNAVIAQYKKWKEESFKGLGELKSIDPILGKCRKKYKKQFDLIDFPPAPATEDENFDDLF